LDHVDATTVENPLLYERGIQSMLGVPLLSGSQLIGVLHVGTLSNRTFTANDIELLELVAARVTAAVQARELEIERSASRLLQRSLLPSALPDLPEISFAARYVPAEQGIGGDWYDAFLLPSGNLWVMVGDVAGHGLRAAAIMGRLRASLRSYAIENDAPELVLAKADRKLQYFEPGQTATVLCGVLQPPYNSILLATTGHLPPVLATPGKGSALINMPVSPPLGVVNQIEPQCIELKLPVGSSLAACTDGLVERRGESLEVGLNRLVAATRAVEPEIMCREIMEKLIGRSVPRDDVALLAMRRNPSG
jgi:serine phosphatase RsbU (regulator of sigma subunit)